MIKNKIKVIWVYIRNKSLNFRGKEGKTNENGKAKSKESWSNGFEDKCFKENKLIEYDNDYFSIPITLKQVKTQIALVLRK